MKFDENLATIHAYLCADGYVIKNPETQRHKYYRIGFRNTNSRLLKDFQERFKKVFRIKVRLMERQRCEIGSKEIYEKLIKSFESFYSNEWKMPSLNKNLSKRWLKAFFDCESWVFCKHHQNRHIGLDSINKEGLNQINKTLNNLGIKTIKKENKKRGMFRIFIYGKENLELFSKEISFLHPEKLKKLDSALKDYVKYRWDFPKNEKECKKFIKKIVSEKARINRKYYIRIFSKEKENLEKIKKLLKKFYDINCLVYKRINGLDTIYYEMNINKRNDIEKLIVLKLIPNLFKLKKSS